ncbi:unnamed protein product, partial [Didymodactylos carnosus]
MGGLSPPQSKILAPPPEGTSQ